MRNRICKTGRYLYSGKELDRTGGLMLYDFHARQYDPQLARLKYDHKDLVNGKVILDK